MKKQQKSTIFLEKALKPYLGKGYAFSPDTNFFMECPEIFHYLKAKKEKVLISKVTYDELDYGKSVASDANEKEKERAWKRRKGLEAMDKAQAIRVPTPPHAYFQKKNLGVSNDEKIIASYLKHAEDTTDNILYLTLDRGAKTIARSLDLPLVELDITEYFRLKSQENNTPVPKVSKSYDKRKKGNPIVRMFRSMFRSVYSLVIGLLRLVVFGFIGLLILALIISAMETSENTKAFSQVNGDQSALTLEVSRAKDYARDNRFEIEIELTNHTSGEVVLKGFHSKSDRERKVKLEKDQNPNGMTKLALTGLKEGSYGVKILYTDGSEEVQVAQQRLAPREKKKVVIASNGQLDQVKKIEIQYQKGGVSDLGVLSIDPQK